MTLSERYSDVTPFEDIYDLFFTTVTDDMFLEWMEQETYDHIERVLLNALVGFEFPKFKLYDYDEDIKEFNFLMDREEKVIITTLMVAQWLSYQLADIEVVKQKYTSKDFELTSQANHMAKLKDLKQSFLVESKHQQRLYKRRRIDSDGQVRTNFGGLGGGVL